MSAAELHIEMPVTSLHMEMPATRYLFDSSFFATCSFQDLTLPVLAAHKSGPKFNIVKT